jgi:uncharacterized protein (DUF2062 family)
VTPEKLALSVALGCVLGLFPMLGTTTTLCALAAVLLRLNLPAIQVVNFFVYPLQLTLFIPFLKAGSWLIGGPPVSADITQVYALLSRDFWGTIATYWWANVGAVGLWAMAATPLAATLYHLLVRVFRRFAPQRAAA